MADQLSNLPVDSSISNHEDIQVVNELFKKHGSSMNHVVQEFKEDFVEAYERLANFIGN